MFWGALFLPLVGSFFSGFGGRFFGRQGSIFISILCIFISTILSITLYMLVGICGNALYFKSGVWLHSEDFIVYWGFLVDGLTVIMLTLITLISLCVHLFSSEYMKDDPHVQKFFSYISIFTFFMLLLVSADNLVQLFFGWEGVGICSYLLINFWSTRVQANKAAIKAVLINKFGDLSLLFGICLIFTYSKTVEFKSLINLVQLLEVNRIFFFKQSFSVLTVTGVFLSIGAIGKSAQVGLHTWLPDAMEGPTPVSALIHAATMVTAGIFLIIRTSPILESAHPTILTFIAIIGAITSLVFSWIGVHQFDIKKIIAYSTCSQLGYMFFICGLSNYVVGLYHITSHACFKALLFLVAGAVIHSIGNEQDIRKMGGLVKLYPFYTILIICGSLSLSGYPFLSGFYSKDLILEIAGSCFLLKGNLALLFGNIATYFSFYYSIRLIDVVFFGEYRGHKLNLYNVHTPCNTYYLVLVFLSLLSIFFGYWSFDFYYGISSFFFDDIINQSGSIVLENEMLPFFIKELPLIFSLLGIFVYNLLNYTLNLDFSLNIKNLNFYKNLNLRLGFDYIYNVFIGFTLLELGYFFSFKLLDKIFFELTGPVGFTSLAFLNSFKLNDLQTGYILHYIGMYLFSILFFIDFFI